MNSSPALCALCESLGAVHTNMVRTPTTPSPADETATKGTEIHSGAMMHLYTLLLYAGNLAALLSALLLSGPVWCLIYLCGPHR